MFVKLLAASAVPALLAVSPVSSTTIDRLVMEQFARDGRANV